MSPYDAPQGRPASLSRAAPLVDGFGRAVTYLRLSVTDRCDLRCVYCMPERMRFLPRADVLTLTELDRVATAFIGLGVRKLRLTGGEPLVRRGVLDLVASLSGRLDSGALDELTLTTNGARLDQFADALAHLGVRRINVSLDTIKPDVFARVTRGGDLTKVLAGIGSALSAGLKVKINTVALAGDNAEEIPELIKWAHGLGMDLTLIETMPLGDTGEDRTDRFLALDEVRGNLASFWTLTDLPLQTGGPARYVRISETGGVLGFITPLTHGFCEGCNRVRLTCTGVLHTCLGREDSADLRAVIRSGGGRAELEAAIRSAVDAKPQGHDFRIGRGVGPSLTRHMSTTGG